MGVIISGAVLPASLTLISTRQSWAAATFTPPLALTCSLIAWLVTSKQQYGTLSVNSTGSNNPMLAGNVVSLLAPLIFIPVLSLLFKTPKYDWVSMKAIRRADDHDLADAAHVDLELVPGETSRSAEEDAEEQHLLNRAAKIARTLTVILTLALLVLWPMPMYGSGYIFSKRFFTGWVVVGILWLFCSSACVAVYPLWEGRHTCARTFRAILKDLSGRGRPVVHGRATVAETAEVEEKAQAKKGVDTPPEEAVESR